MSLVRWEPYKDAVSLQERMNRMFREPFMRPFLEEENGIGLSTWAPSVDVFEDEEKLVIKAELPEMDQKDIEVHVEDNQLTIKGERKLEKEEKKEKYHKIERSYGTFSRSFTLPSTVDQDKIKAHYDRGVLKIELPKKEETKPRHIAIDVK